MRHTQPDKRPTAGMEHKEWCSPRRRRRRRRRNERRGEVKEGMQERREEREGRKEVALEKD